MSQGGGRTVFYFNTRNGFGFIQKWVLTNVRGNRLNLRPIRNLRPVSPLHRRRARQRQGRQKRRRRGRRGWRPHREAGRASG